MGGICCKLENGNLPLKKCFTETYELSLTSPIGIKVLWQEIFMT